MALLNKLPPAMATSDCMETFSAREMLIVPALTAASFPVPDSATVAPPKVMVELVLTAAASVTAGALSTIVPPPVAEPAVAAIARVELSAVPPFWLNALNVTSALPVATKLSVSFVVS